MRHLEWVDFHKERGVRAQELFSFSIPYYKVIGEMMRTMNRVFLSAEGITKRDGQRKRIHAPILPQFVKRVSLSSLVLLIGLHIVNEQSRVSLLQPGPELDGRFVDFVRGLAN